MASERIQDVQRHGRLEHRNHYTLRTHDILVRFDDSQGGNEEDGDVDDEASADFGDDGGARGNWDHEAEEAEVLDCSTSALEVLRLHGWYGRWYLPDPADAQPCDAHRILEPVLY